MQDSNPPNWTRWWPWLYLFTATVYICLLPWAPFSASFLPKTIPIWLLMIHAVLLVPGTRGKLLATGFFLSSVGDVALSFRSQTAFLVGLGFFLLAHVVYTINFLLRREWKANRLPYFGFVLVAGIGMAIWIGPKLGEMTLPVLAYITVITTMAIAAGLSHETKAALMLGATVFMLSDSLIAINLFVGEFAGAKYGIMITYYIAQGLILWAFVPRKR